MNIYIKETCSFFQQRVCEFSVASNYVSYISGVTRNLLQFEPSFFCSTCLSISFTTFAIIYHTHIIIYSLSHCDKIIIFRLTSHSRKLNHSTICFITHLFLIFHEFRSTSWKFLISAISSSRLWDNEIRNVEASFTRIATLDIGYVLVCEILLRKRERQRKALESFIVSERATMSGDKWNT